MMICDVTIHGPPQDPFDKRCTSKATHRLLTEEKEAYLCARHAKTLRDMYEPGEIRKLRTPRTPSPSGTEEKR